MYIGTLSEHCTQLINHAPALSISIIIIRILIAGICFGTNMKDHVDDDRDDSYADKNNGSTSTTVVHQSLDVQMSNDFLHGIVEDMPDDFDVLLKNKPDWIDSDKLERGRKFAMDNFFGVSFAEILSLYMIFAFSQEGLDTLIYTRQSDTPYQAYRRYYKTSIIVKSWLETDILTPGTEGHENLRRVFRMHRKVKEDMSRLSGDEAKSKCAILGQTWCPSLNVLRTDFEHIPRTPTPVISGTLQPMRRPNTTFNQCYLAITHFGFFGLAIAYSNWFGIHNFSQQDMHDFVHLWRTIGYFMGIKEEYNLGRGSLDEAVERSKWIIRTSMKPRLRGVTDKWEHMSRCLIEGIKMYMKSCMPFDISLCYLCDILGLEMTNFKNSLGFRKRIRIWWIRVILKYFFRYDYFKNRINKNVINNLNRSAKEINDENIQRELKNKSFIFDNSN